jgi:transcription antitermination factor NusG
METEKLINGQSVADRRWYALYVRPHQEVVVARELALRGLESYLALYSTVHIWKNRCSKRLELPLFPGYVFVHMGPWEKAWVLSVQGAIHLVGTPGRPVPLPDEEIEALRSGIAERDPQPHPPLTEGQRVRICRGTLAGLEGTLKRSTVGPRVVISLSIISQSASVEVNWNEVEPIDAWPTDRPADFDTELSGGNSQAFLPPVTYNSEYMRSGMRGYDPRDFSPQWKY